MPVTASTIWTGMAKFAPEWPSVPVPGAATSSACRVHRSWCSRTSSRLVKTRCGSCSGVRNPEVSVSMWWTVTWSAISGAKPVRCAPTVSVSFSLPSCTSRRTATAQNGLAAELRLTAIPSWLRIPFSRSAMP